MSASPREAGRRVDTLGRRYVGGIRVVTFVPTAVVAVLAADGPAARLHLGAGLVVLAGWSAVYVVCVLRGRTAPVTVLDGLALVGLGLATSSLTPAAWLDSGRSWIRPFVTFAAVGYQYSTPWRVGLPVGLAVCTTAAVASAAARSGPVGVDSVVTVVWSNLIPVLARVLFTLLTRSAARVDDTLADAEAARRDRVVAQSVRDAERVVSAKLHDTAAATLLMVAVGRTAGLEELLRRLARRDLDTLRAIRTGAHGGPADLCGELRAEAGRCPVRVDVEGPQRVDLPSHVARALVDAAGEALTNVARHAGTSSARVRFGAADGRVVVVVRDEGRGFDPGAVPPTRRGLEESVLGRVAAVGGTARVDSAVGAGTTVRLVWPA